MCKQHRTLLQMQFLRVQTPQVLKIQLASFSYCEEGAGLVIDPPLWAKAYVQEAQSMVVFGQRRNRNSRPYSGKIGFAAWRYSAK